MALPSAIETLPTGYLLAGRYCLERVVGQGGFGITYLARDIHTSAFLAIKELAPPGCRRDGDAIATAHPQLSARAFELARKKILAQAGTLAGIEHPNIVRVLGQLEENNTAYVVMEALAGATLAERVEADGPMTVDRALGYIQDLSDALSAVHAHRLVHLDVKPDNMMVCGDRLVLFDFDLLRGWDDGERRGTQPLTITSHSGTPGYSPLEQYSEGADFGPWTDLYALGATLFYLLEGAPPPAAVDRANGIAMNVPSGLAHPHHANVRHALDWALQLEASRRPRCVQELVEVLSRPVPRRAPAPAGDTALASGDDAAWSSPPVDTNAPETSDLWWLVSLRQPGADWPQRCSCCFAVSELVMEVKAHGQLWRVPYCEACWKHVAAARKAALVGGWGILLGLLVALAGVSTSDLLMGPIAVVIHFSAVTYYCLKGFRAEGMMHKECCAKHLAFNYAGRRGAAHVMRFRNSRFAESFRRVNAGKLA